MGLLCMSFSLIDIEAINDVGQGLGRRHIDKVAEERLPRVTTTGMLPLHNSILSPEGLAVGIAVGDSVDVVVGDTVGDSVVGRGLGTGVGSAVGDGDGTRVGESVTGKEDGTPVGRDVGDGEPSTGVE